jgi:hypothetical protein
VLEHRVEGDGLEPECAKGTPGHLEARWGASVEIRTVEGRHGKPVRWRASPEEAGVEECRQPTAVGMFANRHRR